MAYCDQMAKWKMELEEFDGKGISSPNVRLPRQLRVDL